MNTILNVTKHSSHFCDTVICYILIDYIFSRYSISHELGKGGFGVVYEGRRLEDDLKVSQSI